jgi:hypothetical protein
MEKLPIFADMKESNLHLQCQKEKEEKKVG